MSLSSNARVALVARARQRERLAWRRFAKCRIDGQDQMAARLYADWQNSQREAIEAQGLATALRRAQAAASVS